MVWSKPVNVLTAALQFSALVSAGGPTWPSSYDELEDIMVLNQGYKARQLSLPVTPCDLERVPGFLPAAGFLRTAFHDVAPHNAATGAGGLDASIAYELTGEAGKDNAGPFANNTLRFLSRYYSDQASMSDLIALATYTAVRSCGGPIIPVRTGRVDAKSAGPLGVPKVFDTQDGFKKTFGRMGFTPEEMIKLTACGHTLGGVHTSSFPRIVGQLAKGGPVVHFDKSPAKFDSAVLTEFVSNTTQNPLVVGPEDTNADKKVFTIDGGKTVRSMLDAQKFQAECKVMLQRMLDTVPNGVSLTEAIEVYDVKPGSIQLSLSDDGEHLAFAGEIRVRTTDRPQSSIAKVELIYTDNDGNKGDVIATVAVGTAAGYDDSFTFYSFAAQIDAEAGIESFVIEISYTDGSSDSYDNNGQHYAVDDSVFIQRKGCSLSTPDANGNVVVEIVACVRGSGKPTLKTHLQKPQGAIPMPLMSEEEDSMEKDSESGGFTFYKGHFNMNAQQVNSTTFDVSCNGKSSYFNRLAGIPGSGIGGGDSDDGGDDGSDSGSGPDKPWKPSKPCGEDEACDAQPWATNSKWAVPTPAVDAHTVPGGAGGKPWTKPTDSAATPVAPAGGASTPGWNDNNKPVAPTAKPSGDHPAISVYTGAGAKEGASAMVAVAALAMFAL